MSESMGKETKQNSSKSDKKNINHIDNTTIHFDKTNDVKCYIGQVYKKNFLEVLKYESNTNNYDTQCRYK